LDLLKDPPKKNKRVSIDSQNRGFSFGKNKQSPSAKPGTKPGEWLYGIIAHIVAF
jgi:hypothetical protein